MRRRCWPSLRDIMEPNIGSRWHVLQPMTASSSSAATTNIPAAPAAAAFAAFVSYEQPPASTIATQPSNGVTSYASQPPLRISLVHSCTACGGLFTCGIMSNADQELGGRSAVHRCTSHAPPSTPSMERTGAASATTCMALTTEGNALIAAYLQETQV